MLISMEESLMSEKLKQRCKNFMDELGVPVTNFCRNIGISTGTYYDCLRDKTHLSEEKIKKIENYLLKYGF